MIDALAHESAAALLDLHRCALTLADQWAWIVRDAVSRTGLPPATVEADLREQGFSPSAIELADDDYCDALIVGAVRRLDGCQEPHNHVGTVEDWSDLGARVAGRIARVSASTTARERALAEVSVIYQVDAYVASRALSRLGRVGAEGGPAAVHGAGLFIARASDTEH